MRGSLAQSIANGGFDGYAYAYPHKTSYRVLEPSVPLEQAWQGEDKQHLFLYVHLPFCEMRCGFCNLFTTSQPSADLVEGTLGAIHRQSTAVAAAISPNRVAQAAFGGGTPSLLSESQIEQLFYQLAGAWPVQWKAIPVSFEVSPGTVTREKLELLKSLGVSRISLGAQSFVPEDLKALKRWQPSGKLERACQLIKSAGFPMFNIDLIYGAEGQEAQRWQRSLDRVLECQPEEVYLYPLYIGRLTRLDRSGKHPGARRQELYRQARDFFRTHGYQQVSMRHFRRAEVPRTTDYRCQEDGMIGLGPGARSYTRALHYSSEYAVGQPNVKTIIQNFNAGNASRCVSADYGVWLETEEQKRRFIIKSLLHAEGVCLADYQRRFGSSPFADVPSLTQLYELDLAGEVAGNLRLNDEGLASSDTIGPWLYSDAMTARMNSYQLA